jgi:hypothetical protein
MRGTCSEYGVQIKQETSLCLTSYDYSGNVWVIQDTQ